MHGLRQEGSGPQGGREGGEEVALYAQPREGWRMWRLDALDWRDRLGTLRLMALTQDVAWPPYRAMEAQCECGRIDRGVFHNFPPEPWAPIIETVMSEGTAEQRLRAIADRAPCGLWAHDSTESLVKGLLCGPNVMGGVLGRIAGWGKTQKHRHGFRAQYAYPQELRLICEGMASPCPYRPTLVWFHISPEAGRGKVLVRCARCTHGVGTLAWYPFKASDVATALSETYGITCGLGWPDDAGGMLPIGAGLEFEREFRLSFEDMWLGRRPGGLA